MSERLPVPVGSGRISQVGFIIAVVSLAMAVASVLGGNWLAAALGAAGALSFLFLSLRDRTVRLHRSEES